MTMFTAMRAGMSKHQAIVESVRVNFWTGISDKSDDGCWFPELEFQRLSPLR